MSDQLHKPLYGQFAFQLDADRATTAKNLYLGGDSVVSVPSSNAATLDASTSSSFYCESSGNTAFTITNQVQGQTITVIVKAVGANRTPSFVGATGTISAITSGNVAAFQVTKVVAGTFVLQHALGAY